MRLNHCRQLDLAGLGSFGFAVCGSDNNGYGLRRMTVFKVPIRRQMFAVAIMCDYKLLAN